MTLRVFRPVLVGPVLVGVLVATAGCGARGSGSDRDWPAADDPMATDGLVWAVDSEVHLPDGSVLDVGRPLGGYVVNAAGVWFLQGSDPGEGDGADDALPELWLATPDGTHHATGAHPMASTLTTSDDGRWLAFLDRPDGPDGHAEAVVLDTVAGTEVLRSRRDLAPEEVAGEVGDDIDWRDLYEELPIDVEGIVDDTVYVGGLDGVTAHSLPDGEATAVETPGVDSRPDWYVALNPERPWWNPSRTWSIPETEEGPPLLRPESGTDVPTRFEESSSSDSPLRLGKPDLESWVLTGWIDDDTAVGITETVDPYDPLPVLLTCEVPTGECQVVPGNEAGVNLPLDRPTGLSPTSRG